MADRQHWHPILFDCPRTGSKVQVLLAEEVIGAGGRYDAAGTRYETVSCLACSGVHLVDPKDGKELGARSDGMK